VNSPRSLVPRFSSTTPFESFGVWPAFGEWRAWLCHGVLGGGQPNGAIQSICERQVWQTMPDFRPPKTETMRRAILAAALLSGNFASLCCAQAPPEKLSSMSIQDLLNIEVTSVSKTQEKISDTAAAVYVITQEEIRSSGATNVPDLLRMVPGMDVAQINSNTWAISARGFNKRYADELMVLLDGRSIYLPSFGGVYWDVLDLPLEDIDRIEVIRGPGGSIWGVNAVNGVINIITKKASETKGAMVEAGAGSLQPGFGTVQYGGAAGKETDYRIYSKYFNESQLPGITGGDGGDGWNLLRGGFRVDSRVSTKDTLTFQGDIYKGREDQTAKFLPSIDSSVQSIDIGMDLTGGFLQLTWNHEFSERSESTLSIGYDRYTRANILNEGERVFNVDFQDQHRWKRRQNIVWGMSAYDSTVTTNGGLAVSFDPPNVTLPLFGVFAQDEIAVLHDRLYLTVGARLEHDYYTGFGLMPTVRAAWKASRNDTLWAALSRAINTPDLNETEMRLNFTGFTSSNGTLVVPALIDRPVVANELSVDYEAGYRSTITKSISADLAAYYDHYSRLNTTEPGTPFFETEPTPAHIVIPTSYENLMHGETYGIEAFGTWKIKDRLTLSPGYAFEQIHMHLDPGSQDTSSIGQVEGSSPVNSAQLRSHLALPHRVGWDTSAYFVGRIKDPAVPSYTRLDTGITWQAGEKLSFSAFGQNLLKDERLEYVDTLGSTASTLVKRGAYAKVKWEF